MDNNEKLEVATKRFVGSMQVKNEQDYTGDVKVVKVLTIFTKPNLTQTTVTAGKVSIEGEIDYDMLVVQEDSAIVPITQKSKFSCVFEGENLQEGNLASVDLTINELNFKGGAGENLQLSSSFDANIYVISNSAEVKNAKAGDGVFVRECDICFNSLVANVKYDGVINFELSKDSKINKVLFVKNSATIKSVIPAVDYFVASGTVFTSVIYETEDRTIRSLVKENNFSEEIEAKGATKESNIQALIFTKEATCSENADKNMFAFDLPIVIWSQVYGKNCAKTIVDAYSIKHEVNLTTQSFDAGEFYSTRQTDENILTNFTISENIPQIDRLLAITPSYISVLNQIVKDKEIMLEGLSNINLIYYTEDADGNNVLSSLDVEVPYSLTLKTPDIEMSDQVVTQAILGDVNVKVKHGRELEILCEVKVDLSQTRVVTSAITTEITLGEEKPEKDYALEIYLAKHDQTLWDIAKELNISTADLVSQNGDLTLPLSDGEKIVAYFKKEEG